ncbi:MAG: cobalamin-dependent protein [Candidatus Aenigmarchaeota archaeon]|nr:cobalamin-dependent protein [Candidatus Aenigmarchaeota archaeon]
MKVTLVMPPFYMKNRYDKGLEKIGSILPPLGLLYIASVLEKDGHEVVVVDSQFHSWSHERTISECRKTKPDVVGIYCNTSNYTYAVQLADLLKKMGMTTVLGGPHVTTSPSEVLSNDGVDYVVFGEGEYAMAELVSYLSGKKKKIAAIKGVGYKDSSGRPIINEPRKFIENLDEIPFPARHLVDIKKYRPSPNQYKRLPNTTIMASRGCPFNCSFCDTKRIWGRGYRYRSVENVIDEIKHLVNDYGIKDVNFWDDLWGVNKEWVNNFCDAVERDKLDITWTCECRVNTVSPEILKIMKSAGCWAIFYGVESLDQDVLDAINKKTNVDMIENAIRWTKDAGIEVRANFILALPRETPAKVRKMVGRLKRLNPDYVKFNVLTPYPGTRIYEEIKDGKWGTMVSEKYDKLTGYFATFVPKGYKNVDEINRIKKYAYRSYYMRPSFIISKMMSVRNYEDLKRIVKGGLAILSI